MLLRGTRMLSRAAGRTSALATEGVLADAPARSMGHSVKVPNFDEYKRPETPEGDLSRRAFSYTMVGTAGMAYLTMVKSGVTDFLDTMNPSADVLAASTVEVNLDEIAEGEAVTLKWQGKPLFVRHRTAQDIADAEAVPASELRDPEADDDRVQQKKWLVMLGICTHLGCVPLHNEGAYRGWFCPCHGSHYDTAGRIRKGPAPLNLEVPPYKFVDDTTILVGVAPDS